MGKGTKIKIAVLGGGWLGCHIASILLEQDYDVTLFEEKEVLLSGSSFWNQRRLHLGYHYPRSHATRSEVRKCFEPFIERYKPGLVPVPSNIYAIADHSCIDLETYKQILGSSNIPLMDISPEAMGIRNVQGALSCSEFALAMDYYRTYFMHRLSEHARFQTRVQRMDNCESGVLINGGSFDFAINCTYNTFRPFTNLPLLYEASLTLLFTRVDYNLPSGLTIMDGPFPSFFPFSPALYSLTDVELTPLRLFDKFSEAQKFIRMQNGSDIQKLVPRFVDKISYFFPQFSRQFHLHSWFIANKTKSPSACAHRDLRWDKDGNILSFFGSKIGSCMLAGEIALDEIKATFGTPPSNRKRNGTLYERHLPYR